jgi:hypothetical protein
MTELPPLPDELPPLRPFWEGGPPVVHRVAVRPSVDDVALLVRSRVIGPGGQDLPTFDDTTHPTADAVERLIDNALDEVLGMLPDHVDPVWYAPIRRLIALRAVVTLEGSFYPRGQDSSSVEAWTARFAFDMQALQRAIPAATWIA